MKRTTRLARLFKRAHDFLYRLENYSLYRAQGMGIRYAWKKSDLTL